MANLDIIKYNGIDYAINFDTQEIEKIDLNNNFIIYKILLKNIELENKLPKLEDKWLKLLEKYNKDYKKPK